MQVELLLKKSYNVKYLAAKLNVRYPDEDIELKFNGDDIHYSKIKGFNSESNELSIVIDVDSGVVDEWPNGMCANLHLKVCDGGRYTLLNNDYYVVTSIEGYVIDMMCPGGGGYGDYVIMNIDENGKIENWKPDFKEFNQIED